MWGAGVSIAKTHAKPEPYLLAGEFWQGVRDSLPVALSVVPFGLTCGVMGLTVGLTFLETVSMSVLVFAGAAQFISMTMLGAGITAFSLIVLTTLLINLRHLLMGASLAPYMARLPMPLQAVLAFGLVDETYALIMNRILVKEYSPGYQMGCNVNFYLVWVASTAAGVFLGGYIPDPLAWGLDFALPALLMALLIPRLADRPSYFACVVSALVAVLGALYLPGKWYIIIACLAASAVGGFMEGECGSAR